MKIIASPISLADLVLMAESGFGDLVKAVVDVERSVMAVDADLHSDEEALLLQEGSKQRDLWGINIYPGRPTQELVEFDSMINIRPSQGNRTRRVEDAQVRSRILAIVDSLVQR